MNMLRSISILALLLAISMPLVAQQKPAPTTEPQVLDRVLAIVNQDVILESDLDEEIRYNRFQSLPSEQGGDERREAFTRLMNRALILQQIQPEDRKASEPTDAEFEKSFADFQISLPACARARCASREQWEAIARKAGFDPGMIAARWRERMMILRFIELRFRQGITITPEDIRKEYENIWLPEFKRRKADIVSLPQISDRIQENLLQERMNSLLQEWLKSLHEQGSLEILDPTLGSTDDNDTGEGDE